MDYSGIASQVSSIKGSFEQFVSKVNSVDFSSVWTGTASTSISEKLDTCCTNAEKQVAMLGRFEYALQFVQQYQDAKEKKAQLIAQLNNLDPEASNYSSLRSNLQVSINTCTNDMSRYKVAAITQLGGIVSIASSTQVISFEPDVSYSSTVGQLSSSSMSAPGITAVGKSGSTSSPSNSSSYSAYSSSDFSYDSGYSSSSGYYSGNSYDSGYSSDSGSDSGSGGVASYPTNRPTGEHVLDWSDLGDSYKVISTKMSVKDYLSVISSKGICQDVNESIYGDSCLAFSYIHAYSMFSGNTSAGASDALDYTYAGNFYEFESDNKQEIMNAIYEDVTNDRPVVLQVNGDVEGTSRHYVTVVGFNKEVESAAKLTEEDLLIVDSWDGALENMSCSSSRFMTTGAACGKDYSGYQLYRLDV